MGVCAWVVVGVSGLGAPGSSGFPPGLRQSNVSLPFWLKRQHIWYVIGLTTLVSCVRWSFLFLPSHLPSYSSYSEQVWLSI